MSHRTRIGIGAKFSIDIDTIGMPDQTEENASPPIAILGMAMRLPGGVQSAADFWQMLSGGQDGRCVIPESRYNEEGFYSESAMHSVRTRHGYFLQEDLETVDTSFFDMEGLQPSRMDPQQKLLLQVVWDCLENGGQVEWRGKPIGCFVGTFGGDWEELETKDTQNSHNFHLIGRGKFALANVVSYEFNFKGPSMTLETGCSSSLVALNQACQALLMGDCSSAIVAGTNLVFSPTIGMHGVALSVFSPSGISKSFDASADGYGRGEAINAILIKRLDDAVRDGDPIRAVIRSTMVNGDGRSPGITTPSAEAQESLIRAAYKKASLGDTSQTAFVECHGTGTLAGDPIECAAVAKVFTKGVYIGSVCPSVPESPGMKTACADLAINNQVKPNVGHSEGASGLTSLIKAVLCLENRQIPPNVHIHHPNPRIPWKENRLVVPQSLTEWPKNRKERISISNFGIGGTNAHVILDSFSSLRPPEPAKKRLGNLRSLLLVISAESHASLLRREKSILSYMELHPGQLDDLAYTLGVRRKHLSHRGFFIKSMDSGLSMTDMRHSVVGKTPELTFAFTGQGAQWAGMGIDLMTRFQSFREEIRTLDGILHSLETPPSWSLEEAIIDQDADRINMPKLSQTVCCALQIALVNLLGRWGVKPSSVIGHSSGEIAAAYATGAITAKSAIALSYYRGLLVEESGEIGAMAAIGMGRAQVEGYLQKTLVIACENSSNSVTLSGEPRQVEDVLCRIRSDHPEVLCRLLRVNRAYHSQFMAPIAKAYKTRIRPYLAVQKRMIPMYSTLTGKRVTDPQKLDAQYWSQNLTSPVLFLGATESILNAGHEKCIFLEIGPHSALAGPLRETFKGSSEEKAELSYASCLIRGQNQESTLLQAAGNLFLAGVSIDLGAIHGQGNVLVDLDPYPWECGKADWRETRVTREWRFRKHRHHELLGSRVLESTQLEPSWRNMLHIDDVPWLFDHRIAGSTVFPCAGYIVMAGEAIRQITGCDKYCLRNLHMNKALTLDEHEKAEIVSNFRPSRPNDEPGSGWYEFSITSFRRGSWVKHCTGQAQGTVSRPIARDIRGLPRDVASQPWYNSLKECGLEYGPRFRQLQHISAHPIQLLATASLKTDGGGGTVDPPIIDQCLQLVLVAMCNGLSRKCRTVGMPVYIHEVFAGKTGPILFLEATAAGRSLGETSGSATAQCGGEVAVKINGLEFVELEEGFSSYEDRKVCSHLTWAPDVDMSPPGHLLSPTPEAENFTYNDNLRQQFFQMCICETARRVARSNPDSEHLRKYQHWVTAKSTVILGCQNPVATFLEVPRQDWPDILADLYREIEATMPLSISFAELALVVLENCTDIVEGRCSPLALLMANEGLTRLYNTGCHRNYEDFLKFLGHSRPDLNIVEIGAGTGATTARVLQCLNPSGTDFQYSRYLFTDISPSFLQPAKERFKAYDAIDFGVLDISQPPTEQGIDAESFDLVIASNVLHATTSIEQALKNVKSILKPGGRVLIEEICSDALPIEYIMGVLPGWWMGDGDNRANAPYISVKRWNQELQKAGFVGVHAAADDPEIYMTSIVASLPPPRHIGKGIVNILCHSRRVAWVVGFAHKIEAAGFVVRWHTIAELPPVNEDVISLLDVEEPFLYSMAHSRFAQLQQYLSSCTSTRILWVTRASQIHCPDPRYGLILGFARTMRAEYQMDFATVEVEEFDRSAEDALIDIYLKFHQQRVQRDETVDHEYAIRDGVPHIPRYHWSHLSNNLLEDASPHAPKTLTIEQPGILESLRWVGHALPPLNKDEVEIDVTFVGLNFRDLMVGLGMLQAKDELGLEGSGVIRRVGSEVKHLHTAERVIFLATPAFSTRIIVPAALVVAIPADLSLEQAATIGCAYTTAAYSLINIGRLQKGQSVLIHSAAGGVGIASIMVCQMLGVQVFATVGNPEKAQYLTQRFGIPKENIFDSRSVSFAPKLLKKTQGQGVDLVLNSLAGDLLLASWDCVAEGGMMVEIGKRDLMGHAMLPMDRFLGNRSFVGVDILTLARSRPKVVQECLDRISTLLADSSIEPIQPMHTFAADQVDQAFKYMQEGKHMGKITVQLPEDTASLPASKATARMSFCSDGAYLLVGGLGGLGCAVAQWMVEHGARHLIFLSRSAQTGAGGRQLLPDLALQGCHALLIEGDVTHLSDVQRAVAASSVPIKGVIHMAMVMRDSPFFSMSHSQWTEALKPKVEGAWNLHSALQSSSLDFFVMFSSVAAAAGSAGQANYTAANTFLGAFARYRQSLGLPASVLDIGWITDVGYVSQRPDLLDMMRSKGYLPVQERHLLTALQLLLCPPQMVDGAPSCFLAQSHLSLGLGLSSGQSLSQARYKDARYRHDPAMRAAARPETRSPESSDIKGLLHALEVNQEVLDLPSTMDLLIKEMAILMGPYTAAVKTQNLSTMAEVAVDSLVAVEARAWLKRNLGVDLGLVDIATAGTVQGVVSLTMEALSAKFAPLS